MAARDEKDRERPPGPAPDVGEVQGSAYGSGHWSGNADSPSGYGGTSTTGYGQTAPGYSGYGQETPSSGTGVSHSGAAGYAGYTRGGAGQAGDSWPQTQTTQPRPAGTDEEVRVQQDWIDLDYRQWRDEQIRKLDDEYRSWRQARSRQLANEFDAWRDGRQALGSVKAPSGPGQEGSPPPTSAATGASVQSGAPGPRPLPLFQPRNQELS